MVDSPGPHACRTRHPKRSHRLVDGIGILVGASCGDYDHRMGQAETTEQQVCYRHKGVETAVSCSQCGRPICPDCMVFGPVGIRCPECAGQVAASPKRPIQTMRAATTGARSDIVTLTLIGINVLVFLVQLTQSTGLSPTDSRFFFEGALQGQLVAEGEWYRMITAGFLHANFIHIGFNMLLLWWFGRALEGYLGHWRYAAIYGVSLVAGSAGALLLTPMAFTVGASGAVFGILGAGLFLERRKIYVFGGAAMTIVVLNLVLSFVIPRVSVGGHLGGLVGGLLAIAVLSRLGRSNPAYARPDLITIVGLVAIVVGSVLVAYLRVRGLA